MKKFLCFLLSGLLILPLTGCGNKQEETEVVTVARNDWYGGVTRISKVRNDAKSIVSVLNNYNYDIVLGNPQDYWSEDYFFLNFNPVNSSHIVYTTYFNEDEDWNTISTNIKTVINSRDDGSEYIRSDKLAEHHYSLDFIEPRYSKEYNKTKNSTINLTCIYDATHNWLQMEEKTESLKDPLHTFYEEEIYEFAEIEKGKYALQNETDRMYITYNDKGEVDTLYYSILGLGDRIPIESTVTEEDIIDPVEKLEENTEITEEAAEEQKEESEEEPEEEREVYGNMPNLYNIQDDTIFTHIDDIGPEWVMEEPTISQYLVYKNHVLTFKVLNKLSGKYEGFTVADMPKEPVWDEEHEVYYDPVTFEITTMEEYQTRVKQVNDEIKAIKDEEEAERKREEEEAAKANRPKKQASTDPLPECHKTPKKDIPIDYYELQ